MSVQVPMWCDNPENNVVHEWVGLSVHRYLVYCSSCGKTLQFTMPKGKGLR